MSWWCVAWSEDIKDKPVPVRVGNEEIVLFRDASAAVKACEDRCAHRRVPLSMGWVTAKGSIQCGYHGWAYSGDSGQCVEIPNFRPDEPISPRVKVRVFAVSEVNGAVFVRLDSAAAEAGPALPDFAASTGDSAVGQIELDLAHSQWMEALIADPLAVLGLDYQSAGSARQTASGNGSVVIESQVRASGRAGAAPCGARLEVWAQTGFSQLTIRDSTGAARFDALISSLPLGGERTLVRWKLQDASRDGLAALWRKVFARNLSSIHIHADTVRSAGAQSGAAQAWRNLQVGGQQPGVEQIRIIEER